MAKRPCPEIAAALQAFRALRCRPGRLVSVEEIFAEGAKLGLLDFTVRSGLEKGIAADWLDDAGGGLIELRRAGFSASMRLPKA